jgi:peroxiredoxin Q/BCP
VAGNFIAHQSSLQALSEAPNFEGTDQDGRYLCLKDFKGKKLLLYFYPKDNTPACTATACSLRDDYDLLLEKGYAIVGVSADPVKSHAKFATKYSLPYPLIADTEMKIIKAYDVWGTKMLFGRIYDGIVRTSFVIDEEGLIKQVINEVNTKNHARQILSLEL